ncbi:MAG TPA: cytochrome d ubiquinol oxidase subunit II [Bacteroidales bacterium]|nr:cytochrome d ubiquinol oxidase subunit II [Bacteroidales bacterium]
MDFQLIWFVLIAVLFVGYFFLEGFDFGVGIIMPFVGKDDVDRRVVLNTIGPFWDGNEVWLITAGGAMFAAFPHWYATLFSGFYIPFLIMLLALIFRASGFEFRSKMPHSWWRKVADWLIFAGSIIPAFLWGVAFTNIVMGLPIGADMYFTGNLVEILNPYALLGGVVVVLMFMLHGALFLCLRTTGEIKNRVEKLAGFLWWPTAVASILFAVLGYWLTIIFGNDGFTISLLPLLALIIFTSSYVLIRLKFFKFAFAGIAMTIVLGTIIMFYGMFPNVLPSSIDTAYSLNIYNSSSSPLTLRIMSIVALIFLPIILVYQVWSYRIFSTRISRDAIPSEGV